MIETFELVLGICAVIVGAVLLVWSRPISWLSDARWWQWTPGLSNTEEVARRHRIELSIFRWTVPMVLLAFGILMIGRYL